MAFLALSPKHAQAARALILDAMRLVEKLQRTSLDAFYADEARDGLQQALEYLMAGSSEQSIDAIRWVEQRLAHYADPTKHQKDRISAQDGRLAKKALVCLFGAGVKILTAKPRVAHAAPTRHAEIRRTQRLPVVRRSTDR